MYSQHGGHHAAFNSHGHHAGSAYSNSTGSGGHHGSTDSGLAPQSSFDTVPGSQHSAGGGGSGMHPSASAGNGQWGQSMHYSNSAGSGGQAAGAQGGYGGGGNPYGGSYYGASQAPGGATTGNAYGSYGFPPPNSASAGGYAAPGAGHNGAMANGTTSLNGTAANSAHHSGSSTPTSQTPYHHQHPHSLGAMPSGGAQGYGAHHAQAGYYGAGMHSSASSNSVMSSPSYTSAPQYSAQLPLAGRHRVTTTLWEDEGTLCFQVDARGVCVARRHDNNMINGTKLLNVCGMSRGKRDGILKNEKERIVVKVGAMHLKGVWITFQRGKQLAEQNNILDALYPLFETNIQSFLYHPDNYPRTAAVMAAAQERHAQRSRVSLGTDSPTNGYTRASSTSANSSLGQINPPPLMRSNTTPNTALGAGGYGHSNGYSSAPNHSPSGHLAGGSPSSHALHAQSHTLGAGGGGGGGNSNGVLPQRPSPVDRRVGVPFGEVNGLNGAEPYSNAGMLKQRTYSGFKRGLDDATNAADHGFVASSYDDRV